MPSVPPYLDLLGIPFERGARGPDSFDCYGLAREMFRRAGVTVPDFTSPGTMERAAELIASQSERWRKVPYGTLNSLVTFRVEGIGSHVGYVIAPDRFIHAFEHTGVTTERLTNGSLKPIGFYLYA
ncbi:MAG TPA: C40 family peptidase [Candidatus Sphingomonas excrementigallinarum]|nr:C40 family peptidase [Candidatus Sphingomonas excrementigallinarum]